MKKFQVRIETSVESEKSGYWEHHHPVVVNVRAENPTFAAQQLGKALEELVSREDLYPHGVPPSRSGPLFDFLDFLSQPRQFTALHDKALQFLTLSQADKGVLVQAYLNHVDALEKKEKARHADTAIRVARMRAAGEGEEVIGMYLRWAK